MGNATFVTIIIISDWAYMDTAHRRTSKPKRWCRVDRKDYKKTGRVVKDTERARDRAIEINLMEGIRVVVVVVAHRRVVLYLTVIQPKTRHMYS